MRYTLVYLDTALTDIAAIEKYLSQFYLSTPAKLFGKMEELTTSLEERPFLWPIYDRRPEYRRMIIDDYLLFYHINEEAKIVEIRRILHGSRNIQEQLK